MFSGGFGGFNFGGFGGHEDHDMGTKLLISPPKNNSNIYF